MNKEDYKNITTVIFDMDGVLLDTEKVCKKGWILASQKMELKNIEEVFFKCVGQARQDTLKTLSDFFLPQKSDFSSEEFYSYAGEYFYEIEKTEGLPKKPFVDECLSFLKKNNFTLAVASSTRSQNVHRQLKAAGIFDYFKTITCGDSVIHSKPAPDIYLKSMESLNVKAENCLAVEDSPNGIKSGIAAGLKMIMVPDLILPDENIKKLCYKIEPSLKELIF